MAKLPARPINDVRLVGAPLDDTSPCPPLQRTTLPGTKVSLVPLSPENDAPGLFEISHGSQLKESVWTYLGYGPFEDLSTMVGWLENCSRSEDPLFFTVVDLENERPAGMVSFLAIDLPSRCLELGHIWYAPTHQRSSANTETIYLMLVEAFDRMKCRRVEWKCDALNHRSAAAAERLGFTAEGVFRQHRIVKGRNRDTAWFSMLDHEWPTAKKAFETWLSWADGRPPSLSSIREKTDSG